MDLLTEHRNQGKADAREYAELRKQAGKSNANVVDEMRYRTAQLAAGLNTEGNSFQGMLRDVAYLEGFADVTRDAPYALTTWDPNELSVDWARW